MREKLLLLILIVLLGFLQATILPLNLILLTVLSIGVLHSIKPGLLWAFVAGIILDLVMGQALGFSSLVFLFTIFLLNLYKNKFKATNFFYLLPFTFLSAWFYNLLRGESHFIFNVFLTTILLFLIWPVVNLIAFQKDKKDLQLPLKI